MSTALKQSTADKLEPARTLILLLAYLYLTGLQAHVLPLGYGEPASSDAWIAKNQPNINTATNWPQQRQQMIRQQMVSPQQIGVQQAQQASLGAAGVQQQQGPAVQRTQL